MIEEFVRPRINTPNPGNIMVTAPQPNIQIEDDRTGLDVETLRRAFADNLFYVQGKLPEIASTNGFVIWPWPIRSSGVG